MSRGTNARKEILDHIDGRPVKCIHLHGRDTYDDIPPAAMFLPVGFTDDQFYQFMAALNNTYDSGYGGQVLYGHIWYMDGSWSERGEYDGSEWWEHKTCPEIPQELNQLSLEQLV